MVSTAWLLQRGRGRRVTRPQPWCDGQSLLMHRGGRGWGAVRVVSQQPDLLCPARLHTHTHGVLDVISFMPLGLMVTETQRAKASPAGPCSPRTGLSEPHLLGIQEALQHVERWLWEQTGRQ